MRKKERAVVAMAAHVVYLVLTDKSFFFSFFFLMIVSLPFLFCIYSVLSNI